MVRHHLTAASLAVIILLSSCAQIPRYTEDPTICNPDMWGDQYNHNVVEWVKASGRVFKKAMPYICVDVPEIINMPSYFQLLDIPPADKKPVVAVYKFQDLTGQRKALDGIASFSTAVTQGADAMLIDALKSAGGGTWFRVVERASLAALLQERKLIRTTRQMSDGEEAEPLPALLFAGAYVTGGIVGYDSDVVSGGAGARVLGIGVHKEYRQDIISIVLRLINVQTGEVIISTVIEKTIFSTSTGGDVFKYADAGTMLVEIEAGYAVNEPVTYAVRKAIEAGVVELIKRGEEKELWKYDGLREAALLVIAEEQA